MNRPTSSTDIPTELTDAQNTLKHLTEAEMRLKIVRDTIDVNPSAMEFEQYSARVARISTLASEIRGVSLASIGDPTGKGAPHAFTLFGSWNNNYEQQWKTFAERLVSYLHFAVGLENYIPFWFGREFRITHAPDQPYDKLLNGTAYYAYISGSSQKILSGCIQLLNAVGIEPDHIRVHFGNTTSPKESE